MNDFTPGPDLPEITADALNFVIKENEMRKIDIGSICLAIRSYKERGIGFLEKNDPRIISFKRGLKCNVMIDQFRYILYTEDSYQEFQLEGLSFRIKIGFPTQELLIDDKGHQCFFGGKPILVHLAGKDRYIRLEGPPPLVEIGDIKNIEYVVGEVELSIQDQKQPVSLFLDAKPQLIFIDRIIPLVIQFTNSLKTVRINWVPFPVEFGGNPIFINVRGIRRKLWFMNLPLGIIPGKILIKDMQVDNESVVPPHHSNILPPTHIYPSLPPPPPEIFSSSSSHPVPDSSTQSIEPNVDVQSLLSKLKIAGIIGSATKGELKAPPNEENSNLSTTPIEIDEADADEMNNLLPLSKMFELKNLRK